MHIVAPAEVTPAMAFIMVLGAFLLTTLYTYWKVPTSTIQILVFCVVGTALAADASIAWETIVKLAIAWIADMGPA